VDEMSVPVLAPGTGKTGRDYLWAVARDQRGCGGTDPPLVVFHHSRSRRSKTTLNLMRDYAGGGVLYVDGYAEYDALANPRTVRDLWDLAYCWTYWRQRFVDSSVPRTCPSGSRSTSALPRRMGSRPWCTASRRSAA
jgi:transposase